MLEARHICKSFPGGSHPVLDHVSLNVGDSEFVTLLGASGCGKTTFLRCLAGLEKPDSGELLLMGQSILNVSPQERPFHMVFQKYALFPHMTVGENIEFSLKVKKVESTRRKKRAQELLELMQMPDFSERSVQSLSGGQAQRVALARALADEPQLLLLDEPLSALDEKIRMSLRAELKQLQKKWGRSFLFVTHDQQEALQLSDRIAVFHRGRLEQVDTSENLYLNPKTEYVAEFMGIKNLLQKDQAYARYVLPEHIQWNEKADCKVQARVELKNLLGFHYEVWLRTSAGHRWLVYADRAQAAQIKTGDAVDLSYSSQSVIQVPRSLK